MMAELVIVVEEMTDAIKNPTHWSETLYSMVIEVEGYNEQVLENVFDYLQYCENEGRRFIVKRMYMCQAWIEKHLSRFA